MSSSCKYIGYALQRSFISANSTILKEDMDGPKLAKERTSCRGLVTKCCNSIKSSVEARDLDEAQTLLLTLDILYERLEKVTISYREAVELDEAALDKEMSKEVEYITRISAAKVSVRKLEAALSPKPRPDNPSVRSIKLESLVLPPFDGDIQDFVSFWNVFESRVHQDQALSDADRFAYLNSKLQGAAALTVKGLPMTSEGYQSARRILLQRYGKRSPLVNQHIKALMDLPATDSMDAHHLRDLSDQIKVHTRALQALGVKLQNNAQILGPLLLGKLPLTLRIKWQERQPEEEAARDTIETLVYEPINIDKLLQFLEVHADHREIGQSSKIASGGGGVNVKPKNKSKHAAVSTLSVQSKHCPVCDSIEHPVRSCPKFLDTNLKGRQDLVHTNNLCFNCLTKGHSKQSCRSKFSCRHCQQKHHSLLCKNAGDNDSTVSGNSMCANGAPNGGVHPTVQAKLSGSGSFSRRVRLLLDGCSDQSFISPELVNRMKIPIIGKVNLALNVFNRGRVEKSVDVCRVSLSSVSGHSSLEIQAFVLDVCAPLSCKRIPRSELPYLKDIKLADTYDPSEPKSIDLLIGHDYLYDILTGNFVRGPRGFPVALESRFGWLLHGPYGFKDTLGVSTSEKSVLFLQSVDEISFSECVDRLADGDLVLDAVGSSWSTPSLEDGRFSVQLPWKFPDRPKSNLRSVVPYQTSVYGSCSPQELSEYDDYFREYESLGIVEPCTGSPLIDCWYLPHHAIRQKGKLRVVFDGSFGRPSINQLLQTGPNQLLTIPVCLSSFRLYRVPVVADIEKAFLQIGVDRMDRDFVRFLIKRQGSFQHFRFCRVPFGLCCSPALLNSCLSELYENFSSIHPDVVSILRRSMYCDDLVASVANEGELSVFREKCLQIFESVSMNLRGWTSEPERVLGIPYHPKDDCFAISLSLGDPLESESPTRRAVVSSVAKIFDPMGFVSPCLLRCKLLIRKSWEPSATWDSVLGSSLSEEWRSLQSDHHGVVVNVPRWIHLGDGSVLHAFSDASGSSYATCLYLVSGRQCVLLFSKHRIIPAKSKQTIPRSELTGALLSVRAVRLLREGIAELASLPVVYWTDSTCVLSWLKRSPYELKLFVRNRVEEITRDSSGIWKFVPGVLNPADVATRGLSPSNSEGFQEWISGPAWLVDTCAWPEQPREHVSETEVHVLCVSSSLYEGESSFIESFAREYSSFQKLVRSSAWLRRFVTYLHCKVQEKAPVVGPLSPDEVESARLMLIAGAQKAFFSVDFEDIVNQRPISKHSCLRKLHPSFDFQRKVVVATPRTGEPPLIFVPSKSHLSYLLVWDAHYKLMHGGVDRVISFLHQFYWIPRLRKVARSQLGTCTDCQRHHGRPYSHSEGYLTVFRGQAAKPFEHTGLDFAGPLTLADNRKVSILVFTCACVRAVHLEVTTDMSFESASMAMRRFLGRRPTPSRFYSDNAPTFIKLSHQYSVPWNFIPVRAPWWGGWWERMVGVVKVSLRKSLHLSAVSEDQLRTVVTELEGVINQRPLTYVSDVEGSASPLTPAQFLSASAPLGEPWIGSSGDMLRKAHAHWVKVADRLIDRWRHEYLTSLRVWRDVQSSGKVPKVGDIVLVREGPRRSRWPLAVVHEVLSNHVVVIRLKGILTKRASKLLYPLEADPPWEGLPLLRVPQSVPNDVQSNEDSIPVDDVLSAPPVRVNRRGRHIRLPKRFQD